MVLSNDKITRFCSITPIVHVAVADVDAAYGAYAAAAENNTFNNTKSSNNTANNNANNNVRDYAKILRASRFAARSAKNVDLE